MLEPMSTFREILSLPGVRAGSLVIGSIVLAYFVKYAMSKTLASFAGKTKTDVDDRIVEAVRKPIFLTVIFIGLAWAMILEGPDNAQRTSMAVFKTLAIFVWARAGFGIGQLALEALSTRSRGKSVVQPRTLPVFNMIVKITVIALGIYFTFLAWRIDLTAWMASAGILGLAIGFAAKDTLANLFAGIFIVADAPYKVGDFIVLDDDERMRGMVTRIGLRSTRILTKDDVEITVPNAVIGASKIINEAGGPNTKQRVKVKIAAAYGADVDVVREVLMACPTDIDKICKYPKPQVRFKEFGDSGLLFELQFWIEDPGSREAVLDVMNTRVYKAFNEANLEIPFNKLDLHVKEMPQA